MTVTAKLMPRGRAYKTRFSLMARTLATSSSSQLGLAHRSLPLHAATAEPHFIGASCVGRRRWRIRLATFFVFRTALKAAIGYS